MLQFKEQRLAVGERLPHGAPEQLGKSDHEIAGEKIDEDARTVGGVGESEAALNGKNEIPGMQGHDGLANKAGKPASKECGDQHQRNRQGKRTRPRQPHVGQHPEQNRNQAAKNAKGDLT